MLSYFRIMKWFSLGLRMGLGMVVIGLVAQVALAREGKIPSKEELKKRLTPLQYEVTQNGATEPPFKNAYWDNHKPGIYVDIVSGEPLFSSKDKFDSGTGWPSFTKPLESENVVETPKAGSVEVRSKKANSHLGDKFRDGPPLLAISSVRGAITPPPSGCRRSGPPPGRPRAPGAAAPRPARPVPAGPRRRSARGPGRPGYWSPAPA